MPAQVGPINTETEGLLSYLALARNGLRNTAYGLTPEQLRTRSTASELTVGGLIKHAASTEEGWLSLMRGEPQTVDYAAYAENFRLADGETLDEILARYDQVAESTEQTVAKIGDMDFTVPVDHAVPWNRPDLDRFSLRWVLMHLIQETARHAGHADIIRESLDGATAYPLLAAVEGWPETTWLKPWKPAT